jgi:hypothetical protein
MIVCYSCKDSLTNDNNKPLTGVRAYLNIDHFPKLNDTATLVCLVKIDHSQLDSQRVTARVILPERGLSFDRSSEIYERGFIFLTSDSVWTTITHVGDSIRYTTKIKAVKEGLWEVKFIANYPLLNSDGTYSYLGEITNLKVAIEQDTAYHWN